MKLYGIYGDKKDLGEKYFSGAITYHVSAEALAEIQCHGVDGTIVMGGSDILFWNLKTKRLERRPPLADLPLALWVLVAADEEASWDDLRFLAKHKDVRIRTRVAMNIGSPEDLLLNMAKKDKSPKVKKAAQRTYDRQMGEG